MLDILINLIYKKIFLCSLQNKKLVLLLSKRFFYLISTRVILMQVKIFWEIRPGQKMQPACGSMFLLPGQWTGAILIKKRENAFPTKKYQMIMRCKEKKELRRYFKNYLLKIKMN